MLNEGSRRFYQERGGRDVGRRGGGFRFVWQAVVEAGRVSGQRLSDAVSALF